jgi:dihydroorotate dehydrogenase electron transfer subunit
MKRRKEIATVYSQKKIGEEIFDLRVSTAMAKDAKAGQFVSIYPQDPAKLLPRPISVCEADREKGILRFVYRVVGEGTKEFSFYHEGNAIFLLGNLGNGYPIEEGLGKHVLLLGGGMGIPPLLQLAKELKTKDAQTNIDIVLGYRDQHTFLVDDLKKYGKVSIATDDGSIGIHGTVLTAIEKLKLHTDVIFACGPTPMLRAIQSYAKEQEIKAYISLEERMACGVGACLGCVCGTTKEDEHSHVKNARVCADGPVFEAQGVEI